MNDNYNNIWTISTMVFSGLILLFIPIAWLLFGYPIGRAMIFSEDRCLSDSTHPVVTHFIHWTTGIIFGMNFLNYIIAFAIYYDHGKNAIAGFILVCIYFFLLCYLLYFNTNIKKIEAKYDKEFNKERMDNNLSLRSVC